MSTLATIREVRETGDPDAVNELLDEGWELLGVFQRATVLDGRPDAWALYVLGKGGMPGELADVDHVIEVREDKANDLLERKDARLLKVITRKGETDEYPCFIIGRLRKAKFTGNGIH